MSHAIATTDSNAGLLNFIERASRDPEFDVAKFGELLRMQREVTHEQARREFNQAMAAAQAEMLPVIRDATNTHIGSKYAKLETIDRDMRPIYTRHGFSVRFGSAPSPTEGWLRIICTVSHVGGYSEVNHLDAPPDASGSRGSANKTAVQAVGSAVTYLRRYLLTMVFNIVLADDDDDGEATRKPPGGKPPSRDPLEEPNGTQWFRNLQALLAAARSEQAVVEIAGHRTVRHALESAPTLIRDNIQEALRNAHERVKPAADKSPADIETNQTWDGDPIGELLADIEQMDAITLAGLQSNAAWRAKVKAAAEFPPDEDRIRDAIEARQLALKGGGKQ